MENNHTAEIFLHFAVAFGAEVKGFQTGPIARIGALVHGQWRPEEDEGFQSRLQRLRVFKRAPIEDGAGSIELESNRQLETFK